ncbi:hypothetical protein RFI_06759 [Reticulomyxa filosa]|uniref:non-specific serine/threonine protein kinase n=1 Tax=Reticulomyxa filosa TaxID=46433 RepID=X6NVM6_RETFI|nr:hypothetical protein RFI_06759 [Reticulomyxa filosa]|eukprot:ETO30360.1 hypothetical protein RFI_06759 [Reticulomyxa filosa]
MYPYIERVKEGISLKSKQKVAIKVMSKEEIKKRNLISTVRTEVKALKMLPHHRHVVRLLEVLESKQTLYIVLELVEGGELFNKIMEFFFDWSEKKKKTTKQNKMVS